METHDLRGWHELENEYVQAALEGPTLLFDKNAETIRSHVHARIESLGRMLMPRGEKIPTHMIGAFTFLMSDGPPEADLRHHILEQKGLLLPYSSHLADDLIKQGVSPDEAQVLQKEAWQAELFEVVAVTPTEHVSLNALVHAEQNRERLKKLLSDKQFLEIPTVREEVLRETSLELDDRCAVPKEKQKREHLELISANEITHDDPLDDQEEPKEKKRR